jgi:methionyl-tRNA formyltransferase
MGNNLETYLLVSEKEWHNSLFLSLKKEIEGNWYRISNKFEFNFDNIKLLNPNKIFIPHWSYIIPRDIFLNYECIVFHMTDLPYGRGGSPLQNLILDGKSTTRISAIKVEEGIDTGDVYIKAPLELSGSAEDIFRRSSIVIGNMIKEIISVNPVPQKQVGEITIFKRRKPEDGNLCNIDDITKIYDYIRMLDCNSYPNAFLETEYFKFEFNNAKFFDSYIDAHVRIRKK